MPKKVALIISTYPLYELYCPHFSGMQDGLKKLGIEYKVFSCRPQLNTQEVIDYEPDFILYGLLDMVKHSDWREEIRDGLPNAKIVMWYGDLRNENTRQIFADMSEIDMMFVSNNAQNKYYEQIWKVPKCNFLPLGATIQNIEHDKKYDFDFVFIGSKICGGSFLERAIQISKYEERGLKVIDGNAQRNPELRAKILKTMPVIYRSSRLCLDVSHFTDIDSYTSNRFWNIGASGGVALTKRFPNCEKFYPEDSRIYFDTFEESLEKMNYYLDHPELLEPIRKCALEVAKQHEYDKRFLEMFKEVYKLDS